MKVLYRISDSGYKKVKAPYINNENCLKNFIINFLNNDTKDITVLADNVCEDTYKMISNHIPKNNIVRCSAGSSAQSFVITFDMALKNENPEEIIYFVENDYLHRKNSKAIMEEGFELGASFVTLYCHADKFIPAKDGGNPFVEDDGGYVTKTYKSKSVYWMLIEAVTMTFASKVKTLKKTEAIFRKWTSGTYPHDFKLFLELREQGYSLIQPLPTYSTHGETPWLASLIGTEYEGLSEVDGWEKILKKSLENN